MKLLDALDKRTEIEKRIFEDDGEISFEDEKQLELVLKEIAENTDRIALAYQIKKQELEYVKEALKKTKHSLSLRLENFKNLIYHAVRIHGSLKTPISSITNVTKTTQKVVIFDFDLVMSACPKAVVVHTEDNVRTTTLRKTDIKEMIERTGNCPGAEIVNETVHYPLVRLKGSK